MLPYDDVTLLLCYVMLCYLAVVKENDFAVKEKDFFLFHFFKL